MTHFNKLYTITGIGFIGLALLTSSVAITGFAIADTPGKTGILGLVLFIAGIASLLLGSAHKNKYA